MAIFHGAKLYEPTPKIENGGFFLLGNPVAFHLTAGQDHGLEGPDALMDCVTQASAVLADKAYDADERMRQKLDKEGFTMSSKPHQEITECIFCKIAQKRENAYIIWESDTHMAFLSIFPNTPGVTVVIPRKHFTSYVFDLNDYDLTELILATKRVAQILDKKLETVSRTATVFEGFGVNHVHAKLFPMHKTENLKEWKPIKSFVNKYFDHYEGYISSHDGMRAPNESLELMHKKLTK